jgi:hypothetical protein
MEMGEGKLLLVSKSLISIETPKNDWRPATSLRPGK